MANVCNGALGMNGIVVETEHLTDFIKEFWLLTPHRVRHNRSPSWCFEIADNRHGTKLIENSENDTLSGKMASYP